MSSGNPSAIDAFLHRVIGSAARLLGLDLDSCSSWQRFFFYLAALVALLNMAAGVHDFFHYGGTDLRIRVVSARALVSGLDPYQLTWGPELPETLRDPKQEHAGLSRCTYAPTLLLVYSVFSPLPYPWQRGLWMVLEWLALLGTIGVLARTLRSRRARHLFVTMALALVAGSWFWRLHVERGQYYVLLALLLACALNLAARRQREHWTAGLFLGAAIALRPTAILALPPLWLVGRRRTVLASLATAAVCVAATLPVAGLTGWRHFFWLAGEWEKGWIDQDYLDRTYPRLEPHPETVDGFLPGVMDSLSVSTTITNLRPLFDRLGVAPERIPLISRVGLLAVAAAGCGLFFLANRRRRLSPRQGMMAGLLLVLLADFFVPARIGYTDVLYLLPMAWAMPLLARPSQRLHLGILVAAFLPAIFPAAPSSVGYWKFATLLRSLVVLGIGAGPVWGALRGRLAAPGLQATRGERS